MKFSTSLALKGSHDNAFSTHKAYCYGKGTTYGFATEDVDPANIVNTLLVKASSPYLFKGQSRAATAVTGVGELLFIDIDSKTEQPVLNSLTKMASSGVQYAVLPTQNHLVNGMHKVRVVVPITGLSGVQDYVNALHYLVQELKLEAVDAATYTQARFFAPTLPLVGYTYNCLQYLKGAESDCKKFTVTQDVVDGIIKRLELIDASGKYNIAKYPNTIGTTAPVFAYASAMAMANIAVQDSVESSSTISGDVVLEPYPDDTNVCSDMHYKKSTVGTVVNALPVGGRVMCECPSKENHTDPTDTRYAWIRLTGAGEPRLYCSSDHCKKQYGDFRVIVLPDVMQFIDTEYVSDTVGYINATVDRLSTWFIGRYCSYICLHEGVDAPDISGKMSYVRANLDKYLDLNALKILILHTYRMVGGSSVVYSIGLDGSIQGAVDVKGSNQSLNLWNRYLYKPALVEVMKATSDKGFHRGGMTRDFLKIISEDRLAGTISNELRVATPSLNQSSKALFSITPYGKEVTIESNRYDVVLLRRLEELDKTIPQLANYSGVVSAFLDHWALPLGSVTFSLGTLTSLPDLLIAFSLLNLLSDREAQQRHTAIVIPALPSTGKTSLLVNMARLGLSNDDTHLADLFGSAKLYPQSVDGLSDLLWTTGDEFSYQLLKAKMSLPLLLSNLTKPKISVDVKGLINRGFSTNLKVMYGATALQALDNHSKTQELRSRLFVLDYTLVDGMETSRLIQLANVDNGTLDKIIQHHIASTYVAIKKVVMALSKEQRHSAFNELRTAMKVKYAGSVKAVQYEEGDENVIGTVVSRSDDSRAGKVVMVEVEKDSDRAIHKAIQDFRQWAYYCITKPTGEGKKFKSSMEFSLSINAMRGSNTSILIDRIESVEAFTHFSKRLVLPSGRQSILKLHSEIVGQDYNREYISNLNTVAFNKVMEQFLVVHKPSKTPRGDFGVPNAGAFWRGAVNVYDLDAIESFLERVGYV